MRHITRGRLQWAFLVASMAAFGQSPPLQTINSSDLISTGPTKINFNDVWLFNNKVGKFTGSGAPGSIQYSVRGDLYFDYTNNLTYSCYSVACSSTPTWALTGANTGTSTSILYGNGSGGFSNVTIGTGITFAGGTLSASGSANPGNTVSVSYASSVTLTCGGSNPSTAGTVTTFNIAQMSGAMVVNGPSSCNTSQLLVVYLYNGAGAYAQTWGASFGTDVPTLPAVANAYMVLTLSYNSTDALWHKASAALISGIAAPTTGQAFCQGANNVAIACNSTNLSSPSYVVGGGTANAQTATLAPAVTSLTAGLIVRWLPVAANTTTTPTLAVNGLTAATIVKSPGNVALAASDLTTSAIATAVYDGTYFELQNPQTASAASTAFCDSTFDTYCVWDNFATQSASAVWGTLRWIENTNSGGAGASIVLGTATQAGGLLVTTGGSSGNDAVITYQFQPSSTNVATYHSGSSFTIPFSVATHVSDSTATYRHGLSDSAYSIANNPGANGIYIEKLTTDTAYFAVCRANSTLVGSRQSLGSVTSYTGTVNTSGSTVTSASGSNFTNLVVGNQFVINISGALTAFPIASITDSTHLVIGGTAPATQTGSTWFSASPTAFQIKNLGGGSIEFRMAATTSALAAATPVTYSSCPQTSSMVFQFGVQTATSAQRSFIAYYHGAKITGLQF